MSHTCSHVIFAPERSDLSLLDAPAQALVAGDLVVFPTETVYGLGANALSASAVAKIFAAKKRPATNPLIAHVHSIAQARQLVATWPTEAQVLAEQFWPGPLTLVLHKNDRIPDAATAGRANVALRMPSHPTALALLRACGVPVCAPSANEYMSISPTSAQHVLNSPLADRVSYVVDSGPTSVGVESTVLSLLDPTSPTILRHGMITRQQLEEVLSIPVHAPEHLVHDDSSQGALAPGQAARHYAPKAPVSLVDEIPWDHVTQTMGVLDYTTLPEASDVVMRHSPCLHITLSDSPERYARELYAALHTFDQHDVSQIYIKLPPDEVDSWSAVHDRLSRASVSA